MARGDVRLGRRSHGRPRRSRPHGGHGLSAPGLPPARPDRPGPPDPACSPPRSTARWSRSAAATSDKPASHHVNAEPAAADAVTHEFWRSPRTDRVRITAQLIAQHGQAFVFCRTKRGADRVAQQLRAAGVEAAPIHGDRSQPQRARALASFAAGKTHALVATDVVARGIHIDDVPCVVHFDLASDATAYVHRSGRTGRLGSAGTVVSLVPSELDAEVRVLQRALGLPGELTVPFSGRKPAAATPRTERPAARRQSARRRARRVGRRGHPPMRGGPPRRPAPGGTARARRDRSPARSSSSTPPGASASCRTPTAPRFSCTIRRSGDRTSGCCAPAIASSSSWPSDGGATRRATSWPPARERSDRGRARRHRRGAAARAGRRATEQARLERPAVDRRRRGRPARGAGLGRRALLAPRRRLVRPRPGRRTVRGDRVRHHARVPPPVHAPQLPGPALAPHHRSPWPGRSPPRARSSAGCPTTGATTCMPTSRATPIRPTPTSGGSPRSSARSGTPTSAGSSRVPSRTPSGSAGTSWPTATWSSSPR